MLTAVCGFWNTTPAQYHADTTRDRHSSLECFRRSVPLYHGVYVTGDIIAPEPTPAMQLGTALHALVLQPERLDELVAVSPGFNRRTNAGKADAECFEQQHAGKVIVEPDDMARLRAMAEAVRRHPVAGDAVASANCRREQPIRWTCPDSGLPMKALLDLVTPSGVILDLKTAADPSPPAWCRSMAQFGYHRQADLYLGGAWKAFGFDGELVFVVVGKEPPHEVVCYVPDAEALGLGHRQNCSDLQDLARRKRDGDWAGRWSQAIQTISLPRWAFYEE